MPDCPALKAIADITIDNWLVVRNIRLVAEKDGKIKPVMPQKSLPDGTYCDRVAIKDDSLLKKYRQRLYNCICAMIYRSSRQ